MNIHNLAQLIQCSAARFGDSAALVMEDRTVTYRELDLGASRIAAELRAQGIGRGARVAILSANGPDWSIAFFGIMKAGATAVCMDAVLTPEEIAFILDHSGASCIYASSAFIPSIEALRRSLPALHSILPIEDAGKTGDATGPAAEISDEDTAILIYTSGTTGSRKGVLLSHRNIVSNVLASSRRVPSRRGTCYLSLLPLSHMFGITVGLIGPLLHGGIVVYSPSLKSYEITRTLQRTRAGVMAVVPLMLQLFKNAIREKTRQSGVYRQRLFALLFGMSAFFRKLGLPAGKLLFGKIHRTFGGNLKYFICGGAPLDRDTEEFFQTLGLPVLTGYGLTETSPVVSVCSRALNKPGTVGKPLDCVNVRIAPDGEILIGGPCVMQGYYRNPETTAGVLRDGWFHTGDIGSLDSDGYLSIRGRAKNVIVTASGLKIFPEEIETCLALSPYIEEVCVVGRPCHGGEQPYAVIIASRTRLQGLSDSEVFDRIRTEIQNHQQSVTPQKRVSAFELLETELPKTATRKVKRGEVLKMLAGKPDAPAADSGKQGSDPFSAKIRSLVAQVAKVDENAILADKNLSAELGIDSLMKVEVMALIDQRLGIRIPDEQAYRVETFRELVDMARTCYQSPDAIGEESLAFVEQGDLSELVRETILFRLTRRATHVFFKLAARFCFRMRVHHAENIPRSGAFIVAANHSSLIDFPLIYSALPSSAVKNTVAPAAKDFFFEHTLRAFMVQCAFSAFPLDRYGNFFEGLRACARLIKAGKSMVLFPEGTRSHEGSLMPFKPGIGMLAFELGVPIVPAYIQGSEAVLRKGTVFPRLHRVQIAFGEPIQPDAYRSLKGSKQHYEIYRTMVEETRARILSIKEATCPA